MDFQTHNRMKRTKEKISWSTLIYMVTCFVPLIVLTRAQQMPMGKKSYVGYKLYQSDPISNEDAVRELNSLEAEEGANFWAYPEVNQNVVILTSPELQPTIEDLFQRYNITYKTVFDDADELIRNENPNYNPSETQLNWEAYYRYDVIMKYIKDLPSRYNRVAYQTIGTSTEGREILLVRIGSGNNPGIFIDAGIHAREWITPATLTYIINKLLTDRNRRNRFLTRYFDWYFVPIINVDGYEYTHTTDRYWRKTRSKSNGSCIGVDGNRNWGFHWGEVGASDNPCSDTYRGSRPFSEPETEAVSNAMLALGDKIKAYFSLHSYSQLWLVPWGYTNETAPDDEEMNRMASVGVNAIRRRYGTVYKYGSNLLYLTSGQSNDWAKGVVGIKYAYGLELRDNGTKVFNLPANQIIPTGEETFDGIKAVARRLRRILVWGYWFWETGTGT